MQLFAPPKKEARWYQLECKQAVKHEFLSVRSTLVELATGLGKTAIFSDLAAEWPGKVLLLSHRDELVDQGKKGLEDWSGGEYVERDQAKWKAGLDMRLVSASVQTLRGERLKRYPRNHFKLIIVDEGHHGVAPSYREITDYFNEAKVLYVTATADRGDKTALGLVCESVAYKMGIVEGVELGYLVPLADGYGRRVHLDEIDLSEVDTHAGDLAEGQLDKAMLKACEGIVRKTIELAGDRPTVGFLPGVKTAQYCHEKCNVLKPESSVFLHGKMDKDERKRLVRELKRGSFQYLWNCGIATEGFDWPEAACVSLGRPTKARNVMVQQIGRILRLLAGVVDDLPFADRKEDAHLRRRAIAMSAKPNALILDFVGNSGRHELVGPEDVLGGNWTPAEKALPARSPRRAAAATPKSCSRGPGKSWPSWLERRRPWSGPGSSSSIRSSWSASRTWTATPSRPATSRCIRARATC